MPSEPSEPRADPVEIHGLEELELMEKMLLRSIIKKEYSQTGFNSKQSEKVYARLAARLALARIYLQIEDAINGARKDLAGDYEDAIDDAKKDLAKEFDGIEDLDNDAMRQLLREIDQRGELNEIL